jgi:hypothetical protein
MARRRSFSIRTKAEESVLDRALRRFYSDQKRALWNSSPGSKPHEEASRDRDLAQSLRARIIEG